MTKNSIYYFTHVTIRTSEENIFMIEFHPESGYVSEFISEPFFTDDFQLGIKILLHLDLIHKKEI